jgi:glycosyltransferase involved in cell wall biosynthesis
MSKISAVILTKNSEEMIADCIDSVSFCDEVIVIDNGSTDRTLELAKHLGVKLYRADSNSFAELRNFGLSKVRTKWVLYIDDDERVSGELVSSIKNKVLSTDRNNIAAYRIKRKNFYLGNHEWPHIEEHLRLFNKNSLKEWKGALHETAVVEGEISELDGYLLHYTHRDLSQMVEKTVEWSGIEAQLRYKADHPKMSVWRFFRVMITAFYDSYIKQKGYKAGTAGLIESMYQSFSMFITYARLWELQNKKG